MFKLNKLCSFFGWSLECDFGFLRGGILMWTRQRSGTIHVQREWIGTQRWDGAAWAEQGLR